MKRIEWRPRAEQDVADAALWFARQGGLALGERFIATVDATLLRNAAFPGSGSARHAWVSDDLPVPLRFVILPIFDRYLVYYLDLPDRVDILRVWDTSRGLDALMDQTPSPSSGARSAIQADDASARPHPSCTDMIS